MTTNPERIETREQFDAARFTEGVVYVDGDEPHMRCAWRKTATDWARTAGGRYDAAQPAWYSADGSNVRPEGYLPLVRMHAPSRMSEPAPIAVTDEQREAWLRLTQDPRARRGVGNTAQVDAALLAPLLPTELTTPPLPDEPGHYEDDDARLWTLREYEEGVRMWVDDDGDIGTPTGPLYRLERARPKVTAHDLWMADGNAPTSSPLPARLYRMANFLNGEVS